MGFCPETTVIYYYMAREKFIDIWGNKIGNESEVFEKAHIQLLPLNPPKMIFRKCDQNLRLSLRSLEYSHFHAHLSLLKSCSQEDKTLETISVLCLCRQMWFWPPVCSYLLDLLVLTPGNGNIYGGFTQTSGKGVW